MKTLNFEQMEQVNAKGWWGCAASIVGIGFAAASLPATAPIGGLGVAGLLWTLGTASASCVDAFMNTKV
ncbi:hypothetical protein [uncultured Alistipes sp.]|uniref:hypothetical protein n=1 Tax=uncultured Alistipes sp. TaxID=538949 RepID=UPI00261857FF|nr:hypothetical protein [uncultured Alistipes sp.]